MRVSGEPPRVSFYRVLAISTALLIFAILTFYLPMREAFWNNTDEGEMLYLSNTASLPQMVAASNRYENRPLEMLGVVLAEQFTPNAVDGFLWLAFMLRCASALLLWGIVQCIFSNRRLGMMAALLFMVNPAEPWRFIVIVMLDYYLALFLLLLSVWLYLISYRTHRPWMLAVACLSLLGTLLIRESSLLVALCIPLLLIFMPRRTGRRTWLIAWIATWAVMSGRFIWFLMTTPASYQASLVNNVTSPSQMWNNFIAHLSPTLSYLDGLAALPGYWRYGLACALIGGAVISFGGEKRLRKREGLAIPVVGVGIALCVAPYFAFSNVARTQFFAAPLQAVGWTLIIAFIGALLAPRFQAPWLILATGVLILFAAAGTWQYQDSQARSGPSFTRIVSIFTQVHHFAPNIAPGSLVLFVTDDNQRPFGARNYQLIALSRLTLGVDAFQTNPTDIFGHKPIFTADGVSLPLDPTEPPDRITHYAYSQVIAFAMNSNFVVTLLDQLPPSLLPPGASGYNPHARILAGNATPLRFLHLSPSLTGP